MRVVVDVTLGAAAGERQEDVVEARLADDERQRLELLVVERSQHAHQLARAVGHLEVDGVPGALDRPDRERLDRRRGTRGAVLVAEADLDDGRAEARLQLGRRALGDDTATVDDDDVVGEAVGLLEVLRGEEDRRALLGQLLDDLPEVVAALGVETRRRLVEEEHGRVVHERRGEVEPAAHPARVRAGEAIGRVAQPELTRAARRRAARAGCDGCA